MQAFLALVDRLNEARAEERARVEAEIWERFGVEQALLALDMSQFSLSVRRSGILPYLGLIRRMQALTAPIVAQHGGRVIKYAADNMIASFPATDAAASAALIGATPPPRIWWAVVKKSLILCPLRIGKSLKLQMRRPPSGVADVRRLALEKSTFS